jgi:hypothetical protein
MMLAGLGLLGFAAQEAERSRRGLTIFSRPHTNPLRRVFVA